MSEYRNQVSTGIKESYWTIGKILPIGLLVIGILMFLGWGLQSAGIISKNIEREVVQHSRQYTESKQAMLSTLYAEYTRLQTQFIEANNNEQGELAAAVNAQRSAIVFQMKRESANIPESEIPAEIKQVIR